MPRAESITHLTGSGWLPQPSPDAWMWMVRTLGPAVDDSTWRAEAACKGESAAYFFAPNHFERKPEKDYREGRARSLCRGCGVRQLCLEYALAVGETHGIWGGLNELERRRLARRRAAEVPGPVAAPAGRASA